MVSSQEIKDNSPVKIRTVRIEDIQELLEIEAHAAPKTSLSKNILLECAVRFQETFLVLEACENIAGYILFDDNGHVYSTVIKPRLRRKGYGSRLMMHALERVQKNLWVEVRSKNTGAIAFYTKLGLKAIGKALNYYGDDDAVIMVLVKGI